MTAPTLETAAERLLGRIRAGEAISQEDLARDFPGHAAELGRLLPLMLELEGLGARRPPAGAPPPELPGTDFRLLRRIAVGGMGEVFEAEQRSLGRRVAVKLLAPDLLRDAAQRERFEAEARLIAQLHHPHIIQVLSAGSAAGRAWYAMELVEGERLDRCAFRDAREIARVALQAAQALAYAHRHGILHRDVKPANLLLDAARDVRVGDFGLAVALRGAETSVEGLPPSQKNAALLAALLPYYRLIAEERDLPDARLLRANAILGEGALRAGMPALAETAFRAMLAIRPDPAVANRLAEALAAQGRRAEAEALARDVAGRCAAAPDPAERLEAVRALLALPGDEAASARAFALLESLLEASPDDAELRFLYAKLLSEDPARFRARRLPGVEPNAAALLRGLAAEHPDRPDYGLALLTLMERRLRYADSLPETGWDDLSEALALAERLLGRWPNDPRIVSATLRLNARAIALLRGQGEAPLARQASERLFAILELLFHNPEVSDSERERLLDLQLRRLARLRADGRGQAAETLRARIRQELEIYQGPRRDAFLRALGP